MEFHSNIENVSTTIVDLTDEEYEALIGADINVKEDKPGWVFIYSKMLYQILKILKYYI